MPPARFALERRPISTVKYGLADALADPKKVFETPERVLSDARLDRRVKRRILQKWLEDALALSRAQEEGMAEGEPNMLQRVQRVIYMIDDRSHS